jgi:hypothetical protein
MSLLETMSTHTLLAEIERRTPGARVVIDQDEDVVTLRYVSADDLFEEIGRRAPQARIVIGQDEQDEIA